MKVYLHIGHFKTGTTSIQFTLANNRMLLYENGIYYPEGDKVRPHQHGTALGKTSRMGDATELLKLLKNANRLKIDTLLLSGEVLANACPSGARLVIDTIKQFGSVHVIYFVRAWNEYLPSRFQQNIRSGDSWPWSEFINGCRDTFHRNPDINYSLNVNNYSCADRISVLNYTKRNLLDLFMDSIGLCSQIKSRIKTEEVRRNVSLSTSKMEIMRVFNAIMAQELKLTDNFKFEALLNGTPPVAKFSLAGLVSRLIEDRVTCVVELEKVIDQCPVKEFGLPLSELREWHKLYSERFLHHGLATPGDDWLFGKAPKGFNPSSVSISNLPKSILYPSKRIIRYYLQDK